MYQSVKENKQNIGKYYTLSLGKYYGIVHEKDLSKYNVLSINMKSAIL